MRKAAASGEWPFGPGIPLKNAMAFFQFRHPRIGIIGRHFI